VREWLIPTSDVAGIVYGTITIGALLAAERPKAEGFPRTVGGTALALTLVWAAHAYATVLGHRLSDAEPRAGRAVRPPHQLARLLRHEAAVLKGGVAPLLAHLASWAAGDSLGTAITITIWVCAATLVSAELLAGLRANLSVPALVLQATVGASLGIAVIVLKAILS
jgi:hypothetical protein